MEIQLAAVHEAGHSVVQWLVSWVPGGILLTVENGVATTAKSKCPHPTFEAKSDLRKRLLVLFAGRAATQARWPGSENDWDDWSDARMALHAHFQRPGGFKWYVGDGYSVRDTEVDGLISDSMNKCAEVISHPPVRATVDTLGALLATRAQGTTGCISVTEEEIVSYCQRDIGCDFQRENPWIEWVNRG